MSIVYIGLGSNLQNPVHQVKQALQALSGLPQTQLLVHSSLYRNPPLGGCQQPDYVNAVAGLTTQLTPYNLLEKLQALEIAQGRIRCHERWIARTLDLDMLLYDNLQFQEAQLILPHPGLYERAFVLYPLYECAPHLTLPNGEALKAVLQRCSPSGLHRIVDEPNNLDSVT